eukprot:TRINITY_DN66321_c0_g1_i1.p1 TRINITY_DN66321_c0_g1~~TRINITY_DN66321_c0_g1_i1.p1  ORF type:complete len:147 (+),score=38.28 TRINITY_DN66321_c0_g1_i1:67-507(+)
MPNGSRAALPDGSSLQHLDWDKAMRNHQNDEQLRAVLSKYPSELQRAVCDMTEALESKDFERLREIAQQVMGSSSLVAAANLHSFARDLIDAIDLESEDIAEKAAAARTEAEQLEQELRSMGFERQGSSSLNHVTDASQGCCCIVL